MQTQTADPRPGNILIVDDELGNLQMLLAVLTKAGFEIRTARSGEIALITATSVPPDLILLDIDMPGMDGYEVCRRLKQNYYTREVPVLFLTGRHSEEDEARGLELGAVDYIRKPFNRTIVLARVQCQLELKRYRDHLEELVKERTAGLITANINLRQEMEERIRLREEREELVMKAMAQDKLAALGELATGIAHEINQPLTYLTTIIQTTIEKFKQNTIDPDKLLMKFAKAAHQAARIMEITTHLRAAGRADDSPLGPVELSQVLDDALLLMKERMKHRNIVLQRRIPDTMPRVTGMASKLEQLFINLLTNAIDALERQEGGEITVEMVPEAEQIVIRFADNGCGMTPLVREKIFEPFFTTKERGKGTGLGMPIILNIVGEHQGTIACTSEPGQGTTFTITLPIPGGCPLAGSSPVTAETCETCETWMMPGSVRE